MAFNGNRVLKESSIPKELRLTKIQNQIVRRMIANTEYTAKQLQVNVDQLIKIVRKGYIREKPIDVTGKLYYPENEIRVFIRRG